MGRTLVTARCPVDGDQKIGADLLDLTTYPGQPDKDHYTFVCPECCDQIRKRANGEVVALLRSAGVKEVRIEQPVTDDPPIGLDELAAFVHALESTDRLAGIAAVNLPDDPRRRASP